MGNIITKIFGNKHDRDIKNIQPIIDEINSLYQQYHFLSDDQLRAKTKEFKIKIQERIDEIKEEINELLKLLINYKIKRFTIEDASLEEIFLKFYESEVKRS